MKSKYRMISTKIMEKIAFHIASLAIFLLAGTAHASCLPGTYDTKRGIRIGDCYATPEMNIAMKEFEQRTVISGQRYIYTGKKVKIGQHEYTDRQVVDLFLYINDESKFNGMITDFMKTDGSSRDAARKRALEFAELTSLEYRDIVPKATRHVRFTTNSGGALGFCVEGNGSTNQESTEFRVIAAYYDIYLYNSALPEATDYSRVGKINSERFEKSQERLMLSATSKSEKAFFVVAQHKFSNVSGTGSFLVADDSQGKDLGHIRNIEYTPLANEIFANRKK